MFDRGGEVPGRSACQDRLVAGTMGRETGNPVRRRPCPGDELGHLCGHDRGPELRVGRRRDHGRLPAPHRGPDRGGAAPLHHGRVEDPRPGRVDPPDIAGQPDGARRGRRRPGLEAARLSGVAAEAGDRRARDDRRGRHRVLGVPAGRDGRRGPARGARAEDHRQRPAATGRHADLRLRDREERGGPARQQPDDRRHHHPAVVPGGGHGPLGRPPGRWASESRPGLPSR